MSQPVSAAPEPIAPSTDPVSDEDYLKWFEYYAKLAASTPPKPWPKELQQQVAAATAQAGSGLTPPSIPDSGAKVDLSAWQQPVASDSPSIDDLEGWRWPTSPSVAQSEVPLGFASPAAADIGDGQWDPKAWLSSPEGTTADASWVTDAFKNDFVARPRQTWEPSPWERFIGNFWAGHQEARLGLAQSTDDTNALAVPGGFGKQESQSGVQIAQDGRYSPNKEGWHDYTTGPNMVCSAVQFCSREEMIDQMARYAVPGQDPSRPIENLGVSSVYDPRYGILAGKVRTFVSPDGLTITNVTEPDHIFYDGEIVRMATQRDGAWYVTTHGFGNNVVPGANIINAWQGPQIFNYVDQQMRAGISAHR